MSDKPQFDFSVPPPSGGGRAPAGRWAACVSVVCLVLLAAVLYLELRPRHVLHRQLPAPGLLDADKTKALALKLEKQNLHEQSAEAWQRYVREADLDAADLAQKHYHIGKQWLKAGRFARAIEFFYRSEAFHKDPASRWAGDLQESLRQCYRQLGMHRELDYELADRVSVVKPTGPGSQQVVAEIGTEKITLADVNDMIRQQVDRQLAMYAQSGLGSERAGRLRESLLRRLEQGQAKRQLLEQLIGGRVLHRRAMEEQLGQDKAVKAKMAEAARYIMIEALLRREVQEKLGLAESDFKVYYELHKEDYVEPAQATVAHIVVADQAQAKALLEQLASDPKRFGALAVAKSLDKATAAKQGQIDTPISAGGLFPGVADSKPFVERVLKTDAGRLVDQALKSDQGHHVVKVLSRKPSRQKPYKEVADQVRRRRTEEKTREVQARYIRSLFERYKVRFVGKGLAAPTTQPGEKSP